MSMAILKSIIAICTGVSVTGVQKRTCIAKYNKCIDKVFTVNEKRGHYVTDKDALQICIKIVEREAIK